MNQQVDSRNKVMHIEKSDFVIFKEQQVGGRAT